MLRGDVKRVVPRGPGFAFASSWLSAALVACLVSLSCGPDDEPQPPSRRFTARKRFDAAALRSEPRPRDPWSFLRDVPGVVVDRVDVGGSETAQQSLLVSHGDPGTGAVWTLDGADVTDPAALGFASFHPDLDALESLEASTGSLDVRVRTPGVQIALALREPRDHFMGGAHARGAAGGLQAENLPESLRGRPFLRNHTERQSEFGGEAGGTLQGGRLWLWGAVSRRALRQHTFTEHEERLSLTSLSAKARMRVGRGTLSLVALHGEKTHDERDTTLSAAPEARWRQSGPTRLVSLKAQRSVGSLSLLGRFAYLDAGFRLDPPGGQAANAFEDFRGVFRGSYATFQSERPRLQAGAEATLARRFLGVDHEIVAGGGYRRSPVRTRWAWPGDKVLALERQSVFFRAFRLTGFALPTRDQDGRSVHDQLEAYAQDTARLGRFSFFAGARFDRLSGHNQPSSALANPVFPTLLPSVDFTGSPGRFRWLDLLPRASVTWDVWGDGRLLTRVGYAAYGAPLGASEVGFDNPIGREPASLTYYWIDRNGNHAVEPGELDDVRGRVGAAGIDPRDPASTTSPHAIDAGLRSPRTHALSGSLACRLGAHASADVTLSWRRQLEPLWRPLRGLALSDYVIRGAVRGQLLGQDYSVGHYAPATQSRIVPGNGRRLANREGYRQEALTLDVSARAQLGRRLRVETWASAGDWREYFDDATRAIQDPTPLESEPLQDAGRVAARAGGLGRDVFVNARWMAGTSVHASLPWKLEAVGLVHARDGFPIPYFQVASTGDPTAGAKNVLVSPQLDAYRLPALVLADARLAREFRLARGRLSAIVDVFNVLNRATSLQLARDVELPSFGRPREIVRPRIVRLGLEYAF